MNYDDQAGVIISRNSAGKQSLVISEDEFNDNLLSYPKTRISFDKEIVYFELKTPWRSIFVILYKIPP